MIKKRLVVAVMALLAVCLLASSAPAAPYEPGKTAYAHLKELSEDSRVAGTPGEAEAREYILEEFKDMGYRPELQRFSFKTDKRGYSSANVIAVKPGQSSRVVIVGAHYDCIAPGRGADDNASGVAVMLEAAKKIKDMQTPYTIKFVAFGAEEVGYEGSKYYVSQMSYSDIKNTVAMINLDSLAVGDKMYVYGGEAGWVKDQALKAADKKKVKLETSPGLNKEYPAGTTGPWSDHVYFDEQGIPFAYFEATNWELGDQDGYTQTVQDGEIWHTDKDTLEYIEANYPGRIQERLSGFTLVLIELLDDINEVGRAK